MSNYHFSSQCDMIHTIAKTDVRNYYTCCLQTQGKCRKICRYVYEDVYVLHSNYSSG